MPSKWVPLPLNQALFANLDEDAVVGFQTTIENGFVNELGGHTRFPGLVERLDLGTGLPVYLHEYEGDLMAVSAGRAYRIDRSYTKTDVTVLPIAGGRRVIFAKTGRDLLMAAGGQIVRLRNNRTELLSSDAPLAALIAWLDNFTIAIEINSQRFFHSGAGTPDTWDPLDTFAADGSPDNINSVLATPRGELMLGGPDSIEQFERARSGAVPFDRRWNIGTGVKLPYTMLYADNAVWSVNDSNEVVRADDQIAQPQSDAIGRLLQSIDNWEDAWLGGYPNKPLHTAGQKFILLQIPNATNPYGTKGITLVFDYRAKRWSSLYGWDAALGLPTRWPGWSHWRLWDKEFVGGNGKIYELTEASHQNGSDIQRWLVRTSHMAAGSGISVEGFRLQVVRGSGGSATEANIRVRCSRDGRPFGPWVRKGLGTAGQRLQMLEFGAFGHGQTFQWEIACNDDCPVNLIKAEIQPLPLGH